MTITHWIDGKPHDGGARRLPVTSPWDGGAFGDVLADAATLDAAVGVAADAFAT